MAQILTVVAKKGGVGKTTLAMSIAGRYASAGMRVLVVDLDAQATASCNCLTKQIALALPGDQTVAALFDPSCSKNDLTKLVHQSHLENIWCLPANDHLSDQLDPKPYTAPHQKQIAVRHALRKLDNKFDLVVIDSPPHLKNIAGWNCLTAADAVISPVNVEGYSLQTVIGVEEQVLHAVATHNPDLKFLGYVVSEFDKMRKSDHVQAEEALRTRYGSLVFESVILRRAKFAQSQGYDQHIFSYAPRSQEAQMIVALTDEIQDRISQHTAKKVA